MSYESEDDKDNYRHAIADLLRHHQLDIVADTLARDWWPSRGRPRQRYADPTFLREVMKQKVAAYQRDGERAPITKARNDIAKKYGLTPETVRSYLKPNRVKRRQPRPPTRE